MKKSHHVELTISKNADVILSVQNVLLFTHGPIHLKNSMVDRSGIRAGVQNCFDTPNNFLEFSNTKQENGYIMLIYIVL